jgi:hypothetical protein
MSYLQTILADGNSDAERKARVALQPRDKYGRWVTTGAALFAGISLPNGSSKSVRGKAIGGSADQPGKIRMLVGKGYEADGIKPNTVLTVDPTNGELFTGATIDVNYLKKKGIDPNIKADLPSDLANQPQTLKSMDPKPADALDVSLATDGLTPAEDAPLRKERDAQPVAKLAPALAAKAAEGSDVNAIVKKAEAGDTTKTPDAVDSAIADIMSDVAYNGDTTKNIDDLIDAAMAKPAADGLPGTPEIPVTIVKAPDGTTKKFLDEIKRGNVIRNSKGEEIGAVLDTPALFTTPKGEKGYMFHIVTPSGEIKQQRLPKDTGLFTDKKSRDSKGLPAAPAKGVPTKPTAAPEKPVTPTPTPTPAPAPTPTPEKPVAKPKTTTKVKPAAAPKAEVVALPNRTDDGQDIAPTTKSDEELRAKKINNLVDQNGNLIKVLNDKGKPVTIEDPNAIVNALLEENPNAKIKPNGAIVVERGTHTDNDGKKYKYEVSVERTVGNQFMERFTLYNEDGSVAYDFYNSDYKDSFHAFYGKANGLRKTRDLILGKTIPGGKGVDAEGIPVEKELRSYFGPNKTIENRLKYMRKTNDINNWRLLSPKENARKYLVGRARLLNKSDNGKDKGNQFGNVRRSFVASIYEAVDLKDNELIKERIVQALGRLPDNEESRKLLVDTLRADITERYKGTPREKELQTLPLFMDTYLKSVEKDLRDRPTVPFVSEDGVTPVKPGDKVRFINNEGDMVIGTVVKLNSKSGKAGGYKDTAKIKFGNQTVDNLQTRNMLHVDETADVTDYAPWVRGEEKLKRRANELGIDFEEYMARRNADPTYDPATDGPLTEDAGSPYIGDSGISGDESPVNAIENKVPGDAHYDENGGYLGSIIDIQEVPATDGGDPGYAVTYLTPEGAQVTEVLEKGDVRGPK